MARTRNRIQQAVPSAVLVSSANTSRVIAGATTSPTKSKEIVITFPGIYLIRFFLGSDNVNSHRAQIYRNGAAIGLSQLANATYGLEFSETIGGWNRGDLCQLYAWTNSGAAPGSVANFRIFGSYNDSEVPIHTGRVVTDVAV